MYMCMCEGHGVGWDLVLSLHCVGPSGLNEVVRLGGSRLIHLLKHHPGSWASLNEVACELYRVCFSLSVESGSLQISFPWVHESLLSRREGTFSRDR